MVRASRPPADGFAVANLLRTEFVYHKRLMMDEKSVGGLKRCGWLRVVKPVLSGVEGVPPESPIACHAEAVCEGQVDLTPPASISWRLSFVCVAVSETLKQLRYEQQ